MKDSKISCIIPTYNRCFDGKDVENNPIWWAAQSLFRQKDLGEVIFVDDGSNDYFMKTVGKINEASPSNVDVKFLKYNLRQGSGKSRNEGVALAQNDRIFFMDDDCIVVGNEVLGKLNYAFTRLEEEGNVGAISLPVSSSSLEFEVVPSSEIGKFDRKTGEVHGIYMRFPEEYIKNPIFLDESINLLRPIPIEFTGGVFLADKSAYLNAGGFPTTKWRNASAEEPELLLNMQRNGNSVFYLPSQDPNFSVFHFKYGNPDGQRFENQDYSFSTPGISLEKMLSSSLNGGGSDHGNRVSTNEALYSSILSRMRIMFKFYGEEAGCSYLSRTEKEMASAGQSGIFRGAVENGIQIMREEKIGTESVYESLRGKYLS